MEMDPVLLDRQCHLLNSRTDNIGKHFSYFLQEFAAYARKVAMVRDKGDNLVDIVKSFADTESGNASSRRNLHEFAHWLAMVQDFRHLSALRITNHIMPKFQKYKENVIHLKDEIHKCQSLAAKSKSSAESLQKLKLKTGENSALFLTSSEVCRRTSLESIQQAEKMRTQARQFEELKLIDLQNILTDFIRSEMMFHCRAIEMYSAAYRSVQNISVDDDLQEFSESLLTGNQRSAHQAIVPGEQYQKETSLRSSVSQPDLSDKSRQFSNKAAQILGDSALNNALNMERRDDRPQSVPRTRTTQRSPSFEESDTD